MVKADIIKAIKSFIPTFDKKVGIFEYGDGNYYPETTKYLIENSVTASACSKILGNFIIGKGFGEFDDKIVNKKKGLTLLKFGQLLSKSFSENKAAYIQVNYNVANGLIDSIDVLPYSHCRLGKKDDNKYNGKIGLSDDWQDKKKKVTWVDVFNPTVVSEQFANQGTSYKGQILYINLDDFKYYANSTIHPVMNDCRSEIMASSYKANSLDSGFFGKTLVVTKPFYSDLLPPDSEEVINGKKAEAQFSSTLSKFVGAESTKSILHLKMEFDNSSEIEKQIIFKNIESNIDDKLFEYTEISVSNNIRVAFYNIPAMLIRSSDGQMFGNSGEGIKEAKLFYQEQTTDIRMAFNQVIDKLMLKFDGVESKVNHLLLIERNDGVTN